MDGLGLVFRKAIVTVVVDLADSFPKSPKDFLRAGELRGILDGLLLGDFFVESIDSASISWSGSARMGRTCWLLDSKISLARVISMSEKPFERRLSFSRNRKFSSLRGFCIRSNTRT